MPAPRSCSAKRYSFLFSNLSAKSNNSSAILIASCQIWDLESEIYSSSNEHGQRAWGQQTGIGVIKKSSNRFLETGCPLGGII
jgi:hypothetical protein